MSERVLPFEQALDEVLIRARSVVGSRVTERVELLAGAGRVLAAPVVADRDQPPFDRATRDGYAVRAGDVGRALKVVGSVRAGESWLGAAIAEGEAIEIMTGAPLPAGADAVVMVEHTRLDDGVLSVEDGRALRSGENVVPRGAETRAGNVVLPAGRLLGAAEISVAASCGLAEVQVFARPRVAIVATGDELVELDEPMSASQIRNSNSYALAALVNAAGGVGDRLAIARDTLEELRAQVAEGREADLLRWASTIWWSRCCASFVPSSSLLVR
jgi:molybdopterin molybdotransferase